MANPKAREAKEKGNAAFKAGDYPSAIGHYSEAMLADRTDPTLPLNRAAAYLKLGKNEDAERDSTTVLQLNPSNVKALFRRAQARVALEKILDARQDLTDALKLEPTNASVQDEIEKVNHLIAVEKSKKSKVQSVQTTFSAPSPTSSPSTSAPPPKRRRVPIQIVEPPMTSLTPTSTAKSAGAEPADVKPPQLRAITQTEGEASIPTYPKPSEEKDTITPLSTRSLKFPSATPATPPAVVTGATTLPSKSAPPTSTFAEARAARETSRPSRVGASGGIFRANGQSTIFSTKDNKTSPVPATSSPSANDRTGSPMTMFNFNKAWEANRSIEDRWKLIMSIPPTSIPSMCKSSLEPSIFISIIDVFAEIVKSNGEGEQDRDTVEVIKAHLKGFEGVPRFNTVLLFLSEKERGRVRELWRVLGVENLGGVWGILVR